MKLKNSILIQQFWQRHGWWLMALMVSISFLFLRFYRIETSLLFFNDIGRDFLELWKWENTGKPPLLGPQTSALPFNQSAVYFYVLMPFYLVAQHSLLSTLIACAVVQIGLVWWGAFWLHRHQPRWLPWFGTLVIMLLLQPQMIIQQRFVWNPSFLVGWLGLALFASWQLVATPVKKWQWSWLLVWGLGMSLAVSFTYSIVPAMAGIFLLSILWWRWQAWKLWLPVVVGLGVWNLPTAVFEVRHGFLLTKMMLFGPWISQAPSTFWSRWTDLSFYLVGPAQNLFSSNVLMMAKVTMLVWLGMVIVQLIQHLVKRHRQQVYSPLFVWTASWWLVTVGATLLLPLSVQSHYVFPVLLLGLASLALLPHWSKWLVIGLLIFNWLQPSWFNYYWRLARQSLAEIESCGQQICQAMPEPLFVSNQAGAHPYHNAMEYQYLLRRAGCDLKDIANYPDSAQAMVVIVDDSVYEHGKTAYNELTLFGSSQVEKTITCSPKLQGVILRRSK